MRDLDDMDDLSDTLDLGRPIEAVEFAEHEPVARHRAQNSSGSQRTLIAIIAGIAAVVIAGASLGAWQAWRQSEQSRLLALSACNTKLQAYDEAVEHFEQIKQDFATVSDISEEHVSDAETVKTLRAELSKAIPSRVECPADGKQDVQEYTGITLDNAVHALTTQGQGITDAAKRVTESQEEKSLQDTRASLNEAINAGETTLKESENNVQDNSIRDDLRQALDAAINASPSDDLDALAGHIETVKGKTAAVKDAMTAKKQADEAAEARAAALRELEAAENEDAENAETDNAQTDDAHSEASAPSTSDLIHSCWVTKNDGGYQDVSYLSSHGWTLERAQADCEQRKASQR
ncbi:hypothetical protein [Bifidobacterium sp.]|uniref:hypothetical protein n=1 Tax=Bifidobacterium sp. TaxID=41200 RepID=UPI0039E9F118